MTAILLGVFLHFSAAPMIAFSWPDTSVVGDGVTYVALNLKGAAATNSTAAVHDGSARLGVARASSTGAWSFTSAKKIDGTHAATAPATTSAGVSTASTAVLAATTSTAVTGYPNASNTGVPSGVTLQSPSAANLPQGVAIDGAGNVTITKAGTTLSGFNISGTVYINASNVTLENCKVATGGYDVVMIAKGLTGVTVQNCTIDNLGGGGEGINGEGTFIANNIMGCVDGINVWGDNTVIKDNYIHGEAGPASAHFDTVQVDGAISNLTIAHNTLVNEQTQTSVLMLDNYWGPINNVTVNDNIMIGGGYTAYLNEVAQGQAGGGRVTNVSFTNNVLSPGYYGVWNIRDELGDRPIVSGNRDLATGRLFPDQQEPKVNQ